jgi:hypothetical protein
MDSDFLVKLNSLNVSLDTTGWIPVMNGSVFILRQGADTFHVWNGFRDGEKFLEDISYGQSIPPISECRVNFQKWKNPKDALRLAEHHETLGELRKAAYFWKVASIAAEFKSLVSSLRESYRLIAIMGLGDSIPVMRNAFVTIENAAVFLSNDQNTKWLSLYQQEALSDLPKWVLEGLGQPPDTFFLEFQAKVLKEIE